MNFNTFKAVKQSNSASVSLEGQEDKISIKVIHGFNSYPQVYQGCDKCKTEVVHAIIDNTVQCLGCNNKYNIN